MSKHTPGPWKAIWRHGHRIIVEHEDGDEIVQDLVARVSGPEANAALIAASPDLLEAAISAAALLRVAEHRLRTVPGADTIGIDDLNRVTGERLKTRSLSEALANACDALKAAIAKAEGRSE